MQRVRASTATKIQQLETTVQEKLEQARTRREQIEQEQKEKLRNHVSCALYCICLFCVLLGIFLSTLFFSCN